MFIFRAGPIYISPSQGKLCATFKKQWLTLEALLEPDLSQRYLRIRQHCMHMQDQPCLLLYLFGLFSPCVRRAGSPVPPSNALLRMCYCCCCCCCCCCHTLARPTSREPVWGNRGLLPLGNAFSVSSFKRKWIIIFIYLPYIFRVVYPLYLHLERWMDIYRNGYLISISISIGISSNQFCSAKSSVYWIWKGAVLTSLNMVFLLCLCLPSLSHDVMQLSSQYLGHTTSVQYWFTVCLNLPRFTYFPFSAKLLFWSVSLLVCLCLVHYEDWCGHYAGNVVFISLM